MIKLLTENVIDPVTRENFKRLQKELTSTQVILKGEWKFFEILFPAAISNYKYPHKFGFVPKDIIQTSLIGVGAITWNYTLFDSVNLNITVTGPCTVRAFIGAYLESAGQL